jgi:uncharacterized protein with HEPN domain
MSKRTPFVSREWRMYLNDMIGCAELAFVFSKDLNADTFTAKSMAYEATLRQIELMGEAAGHIPADVQNAASDIPWREMIALRNRLAHGYFAIDKDVLWNLLNDDLPLTLDGLIRLRNSLAQGTDNE